MALCRSPVSSARLSDILSLLSSFVRYMVGSPFLKHNPLSSPLYGPEPAAAGLMFSSSSSSSSSSREAGVVGGGGGEKESGREVGAGPQLL